MCQIQIYRKRFIPNEFIHLKDDEIISYNNNILITKWKSLKPRKDISHGISCYLLNSGFKISKIFNSNNEVVYWYCDIIDSTIDTKNNKIIFTDLLIDVVVYENGNVQVLDTGELADAFDDCLIDEYLVKKSLRQLDSLLHIIYSNEFSKFQNYINEVE